MRDTNERLRDIQESIENITRYIGNDRAEFDQNELIQVWVIQHLKIIGEAAGKLPKSFTDRYPAIPWKLLHDMRDMLIYQYFCIDNDAVWETVVRDLPPLKAVIDASLNTEGDATDAP